MLENRIRELRNEAGISQKELAARLAVHASTLSRWEAGTQAIPDSQKQHLAEIFGVSVAFLMGWDRGNGNGNGANGKKVAA